MLPVCWYQASALLLLTMQTCARPFCIHQCSSKLLIAHAGILVCYAAFDLPEFQGARLGAFAVLLGMFGLASLPLTYLLHFAFDVSTGLTPCTTYAQTQSSVSAAELSGHAPLMPVQFIANRQQPEQGVPHLV